MTRNTDPRREFQLQFDPADIPDLAQRYKPEDDKDALGAGQRIRAGSYTRANLTAIFKWKTKGRGLSRLLRNSDAEIADALRLAVNATTERAAIVVLLGLQGVDVPVASAILTATNPERYTVIDFRALEALGSKCADRSINFYLAYLHACQELARMHAVALRDLIARSGGGRAIGRWGRDFTPPTLCWITACYGKAALTYSSRPTKAEHADQTLLIVGRNPYEADYGTLDQPNLQKYPCSI